ncbi:MAG: Asp-tRNA(Asn)/Glu-tRNA(Gln) amidotransferase subunit GatA [Candidatus Falkowbacteria bacterium]|nr:Asp-tRNA(Asn)/Glu-tRNA(Gln) amidotransferase subunit GatA [Candidatus Falkowbacteria bacterium]
MNLNELTIKEAIELLKTKKITSVELTQSCLDRIEKLEPSLHTCITITREEALISAKMADDRRVKGDKNDLLGIPYLVKDNILTKGIKTTAASNVLKDYIAPYDATIIKKLNKAGAIILGKTNLDEFAHGASTENSAFGPTKNPWNLTRVPGGSSGGSAAATSADMCIFSLGTDTGGSIRQPASFCGVVGLKPSYGRSSRYGLVSMTSSTDVPGPITKTVEDAAIVLRGIAGVDKLDATTLDKKVEDYLAGMQVDSLKGLKIGLPVEYFDKGLDPRMKEMVLEASNKFIKLGATVEEVSLPHTKYSVPVYYIITPSEVSSNLARFDGLRYGRKEAVVKDLQEAYLKNRGNGFGQEAKRRIMIGTYALSSGYFDAYYLQAQKVRTKIKQEMDSVLSKVDILLTPTSPHIAFKLGEQDKDPLKMYLEDIFVSPASLVGLPAISIPCGSIDEMPVGMQLIGKRFDEITVLKASNVYEKNMEWYKSKPVLG